MLVFPFVRISARINNHAEIRTKANTNIKYRLIRICYTDKNRTDKVRRIKYTHNKTKPKSEKGDNSGKYLQNFAKI